MKTLAGEKVLSEAILREVWIQGPNLLEKFVGTNFVWHVCYCAYHTNILLSFAFWWHHHVLSTAVRPLCVKLAILEANYGNGTF